MFYFYILRCKDNTLYCGSTKNLEKRIKLHNSGKGSAYVRSRGGGTIIHTEAFEHLRDALRREIEVKKWQKSKKEALVKNVSKSV